MTTKWTTDSASQRWGVQLQFWEIQMEEFFMKQLEKEKPSSGDTRRPEKQPETQPQSSTTSPPKVGFRRAEKPSRFKIDEGRYEAVCTTVREPYWHPRFKKWQVLLEFAICGLTTPSPLVKFVDCGKDEQGPVIDNVLLQALDAVGATLPSELLGRDFYVWVKTTKRDRHHRPLLRHEQYSTVDRFSLITGEEDLLDDETHACA